MKKIAKAKSGKSFGMLSVKAGIDKNPKPTAADRIAGAKMNAGKAKNGTKLAAKKVVAKKPIKKAQDGTKMVVDGKEYTEYAMLPEAVVTASKLNPMEKKKGRTYRPGSNRIGKQMAKSQYGKGPYGRKRFEEGGEVKMAKKGTSVNKSMGKCKMGC
jgi:hypothetical protein